MRYISIAIAVVAMATLLAACMGPRNLSPSGQASLESKFQGKYASQLEDAYQRVSFNITDSGINSVDAFGRSVDAIAPAAVFARLDSDYPVFLVHGTMYDTTENDIYQPHLTVYEVLRRHLGDEFQATGVGWRSVPFTLGNLFRSWGKGHWSWYGLTAERAAERSKTLAQVFAGADRPFAVICHSIGCEVAFRALAAAPTTVRRVLMLSPDTDFGAVRAWAQESRTRVMHVVASGDRMLGLSQYAKVNKTFDVSANDIFYRYLEVQPEKLLPDGRRVSAAYANPRRYWDHMAPLELDAYWRDYLKFLTPRAEAN